MKPRLLDLFCGAGGCTKGYQRAGYEVVGVDLQDQPDYCGDDFIQADAIRWTSVMLDGEAQLSLSGFVAIHASPPCQGYTGMNNKNPKAKAAHPALIAVTRDLLKASGLPYVIENVAGAVSHMRNPIQLCGRSLGIAIHRHRLFETNFPVMATSCTGGRDPFGVYGKLDGRRLWTRTDGTELHAPSTLEEAQEAMGIDWMGWDGLREAIPPVMTEHIGGYLMSAVENAAYNSNPVRW